MTAETEQDIDDEIIVALSDYLDGALPPDKQREIEAKLANDAQWKAVHDDMVGTRDALSGLQKARAPAGFAQDVTATIHKRSAGRFFARKTLGDRVPFGVLLVVALAGVAVIAYVLWSSQTGSLKVDNERKAKDAGSAVIDRP
jgi:anti-sigma factor RsiW